MGNSKRNQPWWLEEGSDVCPACGHTYVYQTEYRCVACDGVVCVDCVQRTVTLETFCPGCTDATVAESTR